MAISQYLKHPIVPTELGRRVLRARLSLRETQTQFAKRLRVTPVTVHNWESGKTENIQPVHQEMLDGLTAQLKKMGLYMSDEVFISHYQTKIEKRGNALV